MHDVPACIEVYNIAVIILTLLLAALIQSWLLNLFNLSPQVFDQERDYLQLGLQAIDQTWTQRLDHASSGKDGHGHWHSRLHGAFAAGWWQAEIASGCIHKDQMKLRLCIIYCTEWIYNLLLDTPWYTSTQMFMLDLFCCTHTYEIVYITSSTKKLLYPFYLMYLIDGMISPLPTTWICCPMDPWIHWGLRCLDGWFQDASRCHWGWSLPHHWYQDGALAAEAADFLRGLAFGSWVVVNEILRCFFIWGGIVGDGVVSLLQNMFFSSHLGPFSRQNQAMHIVLNSTYTSKYGKETS